MLRRILPLVLLVATSVTAQTRRLGVDLIYDPAKKIAFSGSLADYSWVNDTVLLAKTKDEAGKVTEEHLVDARSGKDSGLLDNSRIQPLLQTIPGIGAATAAKALRKPDWIVNPKATAAILAIDHDLYLYTFSPPGIVRITTSSAEEKVVSFSPDGRMIAFVRDNDLYVQDLASRRERRLTTDGGAQIFNGILDWVYEEEIYGRGQKIGYWWSPDSSRIAFLRFDEHPVPEFTVVDNIPYDQKLEVTDYPQAGDANPLVDLYAVNATGGEPVKMDLSTFTPPEDLLIVNVDWSPDSSHLIFQIQNREQTWLDLDTGDPKDGSVARLFRDSTKAWIVPLGAPVWLTDGSFLWLSERTGWQHIYHYKGDGTLIRQVTSGEWEADAIHGVDSKSEWIYFRATERDPIGYDIYRIHLDGTGMQRLSDRKGTHAASFNGSLTMWVDKWSDINTPPQATVHRADGQRLVVLDANPVPELAEFELSTPELLQVKTSDGFPMEAMLLKPTHFDPSKKYPVYQHTYGGPHAPQVRNAWGGSTWMYHQLLAENGIIVWICDNRTASGKGAISTWPLYKRFGKLELSDIEDGLAWLKKQPWVDGSRIMINGWSYGGFMTSYALTHSTSFIAGIAGGTVSDWRDYDSVYTERYLLMPQHNAEGYRESSPRFSAASLHGNLLLIHGVIDDNVHLQNTLQFVYALQKAGKQFELMLYPKSRHGIRDPKLVTQMRTMMFDFVKENLLQKE